MFPHQKDDEVAERADEKTNNCRAAPGIGGTAPLQGKNQHDDCWHEKEEADEVYLAESLQYRLRSVTDHSVVGHLDNDEEERDDSATGKIDIEAY